MAGDDLSAPSVSTARTANPSMAELSNCGIGKVAVISWARTRFPVFFSETVSKPRG
jgi:hypothetical protein